MAKKLRTEVNIKDGTSPRITSIAVCDLQNGQAKSFSIHLHAERQNIKLEDIVGRYDSLERAMLDEFYAFLRQNAKARWIVWNMCDVNYGFPAIAQRYRALGGEPIMISGSDLFDLAEALQDIYGPTYVEHPHLTNAMKLNKITDRSYMSGAEEAKAFDDQQYVALHHSTLRKVHVVREIARRERNGQLKTDAGGREIYGTRLAAWSQKLEQNSAIKILTVLSVLYAVGSVCYLAAKWGFGRLT